MTPRYPWWLLVLVLPFAWLRGPNRVFFVQAASSYAASIARVVSWMIVAAVVYRHGGADEMAVLILLRGTVGLLSYVNLGLTPGMVHLLARPVAVLPAESVSEGLDYARARPEIDSPTPRRVSSTAFVLVVLMGALGFVFVSLYAYNVRFFHDSVTRASRPTQVAVMLGAGVIVRTVSDIFSARLQARGKIVADSVCLVAAEICFVSLAMVESYRAAYVASTAFLVASIVLLGARWFADRGSDRLRLGDFDVALIRPLLASGGLVIVSQLADWLYAPANQILIDHFLYVRDIATYVPAIQVDAALLLLVAGLSTVLLPRAAMAFYLKDADTLRGYYLTGTIFSIAILAFGATFVCLASDWLFRVWFKDPLSATQAILPLVMIHTVIGGSASIGRSVLFGMGRIKPYAIAAIVGGVANVGLAVLFLMTTDLGLRGIIYATILTVTFRCLIWLPWYTMRQIGKCVTTRKGQ